VPDSAAELARALTFEPLTECAVCGGHDFTPAYQRQYLGADFHWTRCRDCRLLFQNPRPSRASLSAIYNSDFYWQGDQRSEDGRRMGYKSYEKDDVQRLELGRQRMQLLSRHLPNGGHILDIGCATGFFLKNAQDAGMTGLGVELSEEMARYGRETYGVDVRAVDFDDLPLQPETFDAVAFWGCDSNFFDPRGLFERIHQVLKPGGYVYFNFWDFDHPLRPVLLGDNKILYNSLFCFNKKNIAMLLERTGYQTLSLKGEWRRVTVDSVLAWTGHHRLLALTRKLGLPEIPIWLPALTGYIVLAQKV
jgi:SAM-dependent methyltransferase